MCLLLSFPRAPQCNQEVFSCGVQEMGFACHNTKVIGFPQLLAPLQSEFCCLRQDYTSYKPVIAAGLGRSTTTSVSFVLIQQHVQPRSQRFVQFTLQHSNHRIFSAPEQTSLNHFWFFLHILTLQWGFNNGLFVTAVKWPVIAQETTDVWVWLSKKRRISMLGSFTINSSFLTLRCLSDGLSEHTGWLLLHF